MKAREHDRSVNQLDAWMTKRGKPKTHAKGMLAVDQENRKALTRNSRVGDKKTHPRLAKPWKPRTALTVKSAMALQICKGDFKS